jgi:hypothetical protein
MKTRREFLKAALVGIAALIAGKGILKAEAKGKRRPFVNRDFAGTYTSANVEMLSSNSWVRARARTLAEDTPQGKAIMRRFKNNVTGDVMV